MEAKTKPNRGRQDDNVRTRYDQELMAAQTQSQEVAFQMTVGDSSARSWVVSGIILCVDKFNIKIRTTRTNDFDSIENVWLSKSHIIVTRILP